MDCNDISFLKKKNSAEIVQTELRVDKKLIHCNECKMLQN